MKQRDIEGETTMAQLGHNNPPIEPDDITAPFATDIELAETYCKGRDIETAEESKENERIISVLKEAAKAVDESRDLEVVPLKDVANRAHNKWKPTQDDLKALKATRVAKGEKFKQKLAEAKREIERKAYQEAEQKRREAEDLAAKADASDIEAQREAMQAAQAAQDAKQAAAAASKDKVKGMRKTQMYEVADHQAALNDIIKTDREAVTAFISEYVRRNFKDRAIAGVKTWTESVAQ